MLGAWCLLKGLDHLLGLTPSGIFEKSRDAAPKTKLFEKLSSDSSGKTKDSQVGSSRPGSWKGYVSFYFIPTKLHINGVSFYFVLVKLLK